MIHLLQLFTNRSSAADDNDDGDDDTKIDISLKLIGG